MSLVIWTTILGTGHLFAWLVDIVWEFLFFGLLGFGGFVC